ncbi:hypothetical protein [Hydrogenophaga sp.]|uniref:COG4648 family protein n=1 Tax=Hydrogenophaga sp. TaxID=1904254 RepID=UPI00272A3856|nr:hypothetical protein [Hydrogenophaga sp.]
MRESSVLRNVVLLLVTVAWIVAAHLGSIGWGNASFNAAVAVFPIAVAALMAVWRLPQWLLRVGGVLLLCALLAWLWPRLRDNVPLMYYLQHLGLHAALAVFFGKSLLGPGDAVITRMARRIFPPPLSERNVRYTRGATLAWTLFFCVNALVSTLLFIFAPLNVWSVHANVLTSPLVGLMFLAEYLLRFWLLPPEERPGIKAIIEAYRRESALRSATGASKP